MESGLSEVTGVIREDPDAIIIEYQSKLLGLVKSSIKSIQIPFREVEEVRYSSNLFQARLRILLKTLRNMGDFPAPKQGELVFKVSRKNREHARRFASSANLSASRYEILEDEDDEWV